MSQQLILKKENAADYKLKSVNKIENPCLQQYSDSGMQNMIGNHGALRRSDLWQIQAKLKISEPNDPYEQEADRVADIVVKMTKPKRLTQSERYHEVISINQNVDEKFASLNQRQTSSNNEAIQTKNIRNQPIVGTPYFFNSLNDMFQSGGQAMSITDRSFFESRFGHDFSTVRIHASIKAEEYANYLNAAAFSVGNNIVFAKGNYAPQHQAGKILLAHELTHIVQHKNNKNLLSRLTQEEYRKKIVQTALCLSEEHYLMGTAGQIPDNNGGLNSRKVVLNDEDHGASVDVYYGKDKVTKKPLIKTHVCAGRPNKCNQLSKGDPSNINHQNNYHAYRWSRVSDGEALWGEACEGKRHFDCGGFVTYCYNAAGAITKYPGYVGNLLTKNFGWSEISKEKIQPGDIAYRSGHAGICIDNTQVISALGKKYGIQKESVGKYSVFGYLDCLDHDNLKASNKSSKTIKIPEIKIIGVVCQCDSNTETEYDSKTFRLLNSLAPFISFYSKQRNVEQAAVAGAIADEYNTRRGTKGIIDNLQDKLIGSLSEFAIRIDQFFDFKQKLLNSLENDIGLANIKVRTALELVRNRELKISGQSLTNIQITKIIEYLLTERGTVDVASAVIAKAKTLFSPYVKNHGDELRESIFVEYFKQGDRYYQRFLVNLKTNPKHNICPGEGGCRFWYNREKIVDAIS